MPIDWPELIAWPWFALAALVGAGLGLLISWLKR
jgi:hypothetical protein